MLASVLPRTVGGQQYCPRVTVLDDRSNSVDKHSNQSPGLSEGGPVVAGQGGGGLWLDDPEQRFEDWAVSWTQQDLERTLVVRFQERAADV